MDNKQNSPNGMLGSFAKSFETTSWVLFEKDKLKSQLTEPN